MARAFQFVENYKIRSAKGGYTKKVRLGAPVSGSIRSIAGYSGIPNYEIRHEAGEREGLREGEGRVTEQRKNAVHLTDFKSLYERASSTTFFVVSIFINNFLKLDVVIKPSSCTVISRCFNNVII